jgi:hypothetical protein
MDSTSTEAVPADLDAAVRAAVARDYPGREISAIRSCAMSPSERVLRVYLPVPNLRPTPYVVYRVELPSKLARQLQGQEAEPYRIANYK